MVIGLVTGILDSVFGVIDKAVTDKDKAAEIKANLQMQMLDQESQLMKSAASIIEAEANADSWLTKSWRPITMLTFLALMCFYWLGFAPEYLSNNPDLVASLFTILQVGIMGYVGGRSVEKGVKIWKDNS